MDNTVRVGRQTGKAFAILQKFDPDGKPAGKPIVSGIEGVKIYISKGNSINGLGPGTEVTAEFLNISEDAIKNMIARGILEKK